MMQDTPCCVKDVQQLDDMLSEPTDYLVAAMKRLEGDVLILGSAGKIGPTLARMAKRACDASGKARRIIGVDRFPVQQEAEKLQSWGIETIKCDLLDEAQIQTLPEVPNIIYMAGMKFGSTGQEALTWAMNSYLPGMVSQRFRNSRIVAFSTGNVYGLCPMTKGGSLEQDELHPVGEYAMSCLGRERIFQHFSKTLKIPMAIIRLNYATELRYGVLVDIAQKVWAGQDVDVAMGYCNVIWQADASAMTLAALEHTACPPKTINVCGPELLSVRAVAQQYATLMGKTVNIVGTEQPEALLNNSSQAFELFAKPRVSADQLINWIAQWTMQGGSLLGKPTHFEARDGKY
jgi:nucleoside-diphosphate-sugar epimerase